MKGAQHKNCQTFELLVSVGCRMPFNVRLRTEGMCSSPVNHPWMVQERNRVPLSPDLILLRMSRHLRIDRDLCKCTVFGMWLEENLLFVITVVLELFNVSENLVSKILMAPKWHPCRYFWFVLSRTWYHLHFCINLNYHDWKKFSFLNSDSNPEPRKVSKTTAKCTSLQSNWSGLIFSPMRCVDFIFAAYKNAFLGITSKHTCASFGTTR